MSLCILPPYMYLKNWYTNFDDTLHVAQTCPKEGYRTTGTSGYSPVFIAKKLFKDKMSDKENRLRSSPFWRVNIKDNSVFQVVNLFSTCKIHTKGVFTCSILASIETILVSSVVILTSIDPILEKCVHLQMQYS